MYLFIIIIFFINKLFANSSRKNIIPNIIFRTSVENLIDCHEKLLHVFNQTVSINPEYVQIYFDQNDVLNFLADYFPQYLADFNAITAGAYQADIFRLLVLYQFGGVYADVGYQFLHGLKNFLFENDEFLASKDRPDVLSLRSSLSQGFLASFPQHPFLKYSIERIMHSVRNKLYHCTALDITGPQALGRHFNTFIGKFPSATIADGIILHNGLKFRNLIHINKGEYITNTTGNEDHFAKYLIKTKFDGYHEVMYQRFHKLPYALLWKGHWVYANQSSEPTALYEGQILKEGRNFYYVFKGQRRPFPSWDVFVGMGFDTCEAGYRSIPESIELIPMGPMFSKNITQNEIEISVAPEDIEPLRSDARDIPLSAADLQSLRDIAKGQTITYGIFKSFLKERGNEKDEPHFFEWDHNEKRFVRHYLESLPADAPSRSKNFLAENPRHKFRSFSQVQQDIAVLRLTGDKSDGYYVDLAANDYMSGSNTYVLDRFNHWKGVCIEPNENFWEGLLAQRSCQLFVNPVSRKNGEEVTFRLARGGTADVGGIVGDEFDNKAAEGFEEIIKYTTTLTSILDFVGAPPVMDYLSLDIEGAEHYALKGFDFRRYTFQIMTVERPKQSVHELLTSHGYFYVYTFPGNFGECLYIHKSKEDFLDVMNRQRTKEEPVWFSDIRYFQVVEKRPYMLIPSWP